MKYYLFLFFITIGLSACELKDNFLEVNADPELLGTWNLIEVYLDPGDGSGDFRPVESDKQVTFQIGGIISSNGDLCSMSLEADKVTIGRYSMMDSTFSAPSCNNPDYDYRFTYNDSVLVIAYPCIEPCLMKYKKHK